MNVFEFVFLLVLLELTGLGSVWAYLSGGYTAALFVPVGALFLVIGLRESVTRRMRHVDSGLDDDAPGG